MEFLNLGLKVLNESNRYDNVVSVAMVVVCDVVCCRFAWSVGRVVTPAPDNEPS